MSIRFDGRVAIVTGAGNGLGFEHARQLAELGAHVVVNDVGASVDGEGGAAGAAEAAASKIREAGGSVLASLADITDPDQVGQMVDAALAQWGRVDILINNAGILRDKSFSKMTLDDFRRVIDVHLVGAFNCTKAVWDIMKGQENGRILMTSSASGIFGNFGQANYGAAKAALVGLMNVLHLEGAKYGIRVNTLAPSAATRMLEGLISEESAKVMSPALVSPGALFLVSEDAPSKTILGAGAGSFAMTYIEESTGVHLGLGHTTPDDVAARWDEIANKAGAGPLASAFEQMNKFVALADRGGDV